jgi:NADH dehydrogenase [ubiquinone] 1 alpha subcomplex assembly factor 7
MFRQIVKANRISQLKRSGCLYHGSHVTLEDKEASDGFSIAVDRSGLILPRHIDRSPGSTGKKSEIKGEDSLVKHLQSLIQFRGGPLTVAEYMHEVLTHPTHGYYTTKSHVFGSQGDFITSPEISQMFGELIGVWCVAMWQQLGCPKHINLVELGPGKGTLMADLLRATTPFKDFQKSISVSLVEVSPRLRDIQKDSLETWSHVLSWYSSLEDVPQKADVPSLYIGHEFLDAMPIHQFVRKKPQGSWHEVVVDIADTEDDEHDFRLTLSPYDTFASKTVLPSRLRDLPKEVSDTLDAIEISPACMGLASELAQRVRTNGGAALLIDYGQDGPYENSLVAIKDHEFVDILSDPGKADLSAYVDFQAMRTAIEKSSAGSSVTMHGPINQSVLLKSLGIDSRLHSLVQAAETESQKISLLDGYKRLVGETGNGSEGNEPQGMGSRYKAICIGNRTDPPVAF